MKSKLWEGQAAHLLVLAVLLIPVIGFAMQPGRLQGSWLDLSTRAWYAIALMIPILHQFGVMILWRLELHRKALTRWLGKHAFRAYRGFFFPGLIARPLSLVALALADRHTLAAPRWILYLIAALMFPVLLYLFYSIARYFGVERAAGADHFIEAYRHKPLVDDGIYRYLPNAMYTVGFFALYIPALLFASRAALIVSAFQHILIWGHYLFTEKPDMRRIYGQTADG